MRTLIFVFEQQWRQNLRIQGTRTACECHNTLYRVVLLYFHANFYMLRTTYIRFQLKRTRHLMTLSRTEFDRFIPRSHISRQMPDTHAELNIPIQFYIYTSRHDTHSQRVKKREIWKGRKILIIRLDSGKLKLRFFPQTCKKLNIIHPSRTPSKITNIVETVFSIPIELDDVVFL